MTTESQINANRQNAQQSTGPRTDEGKAKVAQNATKHGLFSQKTVVIPILFGSGFAVRLSGLDPVPYLSKVSSHRAYAGVCSLEGRSIKPGCNQGGD